ncbi:hypothetical protein ABIE39_001547 [Cellulosimicrobium sp. 4261]
MEGASSRAPRRPPEGYDRLTNTASSAGGLAITGGDVVAVAPPDARGVVGPVPDGRRAGHLLAGGDRPVVVRGGTRQSWPASVASAFVHRACARSARSAVSMLRSTTRTSVPESSGSSVIAMSW